MIKMKYGILGKGEVAPSIAIKLIELGHEVMLGARCSTNEKAVIRAETKGGHIQDQTRHIRENTKHLRRIQFSET